MGICFTKKTIEEIVKSKYSLAKDSPTKEKFSQIYHVYIWKYTGDDLSSKAIQLIDLKDDFISTTASKQRSGNSAQNNYQKNQEPQYLVGQPLKWPIKAYADQGYIVLTIKNNKKQLKNLCQRFNSSFEHNNNQSSDLAKKKVSLQMLQILYMIHLDSFRSYYYAEIQQQRQNNQFQASIQIIVGDLLQKIDCLKLVTISFELEKYIQIGGQNSLKKFYNEFENMTIIEDHNLKQGQSLKPPQRQVIAGNIITQSLQKLGECIQTFATNQLEIQRIVFNQIKRIYNSENFEIEKDKEIEVQKLLDKLYDSFAKFNVLKISILENIQKKIIGDYQSQKQHSLNQKNFIPQHITKPVIDKIQTDKQEIENQKLNIVISVTKKQAENAVLSKQTKSLKIQNQDSIDIDNNDISIIEKPHGAKNAKNDKKQMLDTSSPFICEITQIGGIQQSFDKGIMSGKKFQTGKIEKKTSKFSKKDQILHQNGDIQDSMFLPKELQQLRIDRNLYKISSKFNDFMQSNLILTTYAGSGGFQQLQKENVSLIINMSPKQCYNYFIRDFQYKWYNLQPLHKIMTEGQLFTEKYIEVIGEDNLPFFNIECLIFGIIQQIRLQLQRQNDGGNLRPNKVAIFCCHKNLIYSGTVAVAYLMFSNQYRLSFDQAYQVVRQSTKNKFQIPKLYEAQLKDIQTRVDQSSSTNSLNALNNKSSSYKGYEIGLYSKEDLELIVNRYIGQLASSNQLQTLDNNTLKTYFLVPNNLTSIIIKTINIMRQDSSLLISQNYLEKLKNISKLIKNMGITLRLFCGKQITNEQRQIYLSFAKDHLISQLIRYQYMNFSKKIFNVQKYQAKVDLIIEALKDLIVLESLEKSFRKPQPYDQTLLSVVKDIQLLKKSPSNVTQDQIMPFNSRETLTFKYPILRPIFEGKKKDSYYFMIKKFQDKGEYKTNGMGCYVTFFKGQNWIGLQEDKERYFQKIVQQYLRDVSEDRIWIEDQEKSQIQTSLFDGESMIF